MSTSQSTIGLALAAALIPAGALMAQGVTTAAMNGAVTSADSASIESAVVTITNTANGERWQVTTGPRGRYLIEYLSLGGPYTVSTRAIGFHPATMTGIMLSLGERRRLNVMLTPMTIELVEIAVTAETDPVLNAGRTGPAETITSRQALGLPVPGRDFSQLTFLSPQAVITGDQGTSVAGQSDRLNGLQIDGANNSDLGGINGLFGFGTAGALNGARALSIEAIRELQVVVAPFDVRYGTFAGGLVNAVTRSGSNRWEGSLSSYYQSEALTGKDPYGNRAQDFSNKELTVTLAGPLVKNRAAFFVDASVQRAVGMLGPTIGTDTTGGLDSVGTGVRRASATRFQDILRDTYQVDPGSIDATAPRNPAWNAFGKLTLWPALNHRIELSQNHAEGTPESGAEFDGLNYHLSSQGIRNPGTVNATRLTWTMAGSGRLTNELLVSRLSNTDECEPASNYSEVRVPADNGSLRAGAPFRCGGVFAKNTTWEATDNVSWFTGSHHLMLGLHAEQNHLTGLRRLFRPLGIWNFSSLDSLEAGLPFQYRRDVADPKYPDGLASDFRAKQIGLYIQDQWTPVSNLTITAGLRFDVPFLPDPVPLNQMLLDSLGINSSLTPSGNLQWSPRLGFNYDFGGRGTAFLRGGIGLFAGRPIYLYFSDVYETSALETRFLDCAGPDVPGFTLDPDNQPSTCGSGVTPVPTPSFFNPDFRFPRNLRVSLGTDIRLPWNLVGTVDFLYVKGVDQLDVVDANLAPAAGRAGGEGGRLMYGTVDPVSGVATPNRLSNAFGRVPEMRNGSGDRAFSFTTQLQKRLGSGTHVSVAYTYTDARDRMSAVCFNLTCNLDWVPVDGSLEQRNLATSRFEAAHKVTIGGVVGLPARFQVGLFYNGFSGIPYTYLVAGDPNADGLTEFGGNDAVYVPQNATDITLKHPAQWDRLDRIISGTPCLRSQRGKVMARNSCADHWLTLLNARIAKQFGLPGGQGLELMADVFNLLNLLDSDWGIQRKVDGFGGDTRLFEQVGYDQVNQRGIYNLLRVRPNARDEEATRWRLQLGARYTF